MEPEEVADVFAVTLAQLERWRRDTPGGPPWFRFGPRTPRYLRSEVEAWARSKRVDGPLDADRQLDLTVSSTLTSGEDGR